MSHEMNPMLFDLAEWRLAGENEKKAFVPGDPAAGGMPPGAMPPGGAPPMDPMAGGGAPPMDPAMAGAAPPMDPAAMAGAPPAAAPAPAAGGAPGAGGKPKIDPTFIYMELSRVRKLLTHMMKHTGIDMPPDILDDGAVAMVAQGQMPQSAPLGAGAEGAPPEGGGGGPALPGIGGNAPVSPIEAPSGPEKAGADALSMFRGPVDGEREDASQLRLDAISAMSRSLHRR